MLIEIMLQNLGHDPRFFTSSHAEFTRGIDRFSIEHTRITVAVLVPGKIGWAAILIGATVVGGL
jgi:hypothetical protein